MNAFMKDKCNKWSPLYISSHHIKDLMLMILQQFERPHFELQIEDLYLCIFSLTFSCQHIQFWSSETLITSMEAVWFVFLLKPAANPDACLLF